MNNLDKKYTDLLQDILDNGVRKEDRTGTGTLSIFGRQIRHKMSEGFPLLTTKKMYFKGIVTELLWFLRGDTNIKYLVDNDCHIWDGDAYKAFCKERLEIHEKIVKENPTHDFQPWEETISKEEFINKIKTDRMFAFEWGELGPIYGTQWRRWFPGGIDQIQNLINDLKTNPDSRRLMVSAWNVGELDQMVLPPCHYGFQVYTRELSYDEKVREARKRFGFELEDGTRTFDINTTESIKFLQSTQRAISLMWNQRSVDTFLGLPFNIASYGLLLEIIAKEVNMIPDELIGNLGDTHLYLNHIEQAKEQIGIEFTEEEIQEHLQQSGMDALKYEPRMEYISKLPKRTREPYPLPTLDIHHGILDYDLAKLEIDMFTIKNYQSHPPIKAPLSN